MKQVYKLLQAESIHELADKVNAAIGIGYDVAGGVAATVIKNQVIYYQAVIIRQY